jgi:hypothetical protein
MKRIDTHTLATRIYIKFAQELFSLQRLKHLTPAQQKSKKRLETINKVLSKV